MSNLLIHDMDTAWTSSNPAVLQVAVDTQKLFGEDMTSNRLTAQSGALNAFAEFIPGAPLNLSDFDELRFWVRANRKADGSRSKPFYLEFSYTDANDTPGEEHHWFVPVNRAGAWEQRRIGIQDDRRSAITRFRLRCLTDLPFTCYIGELLAVREEMLEDLEQALVTQLDSQLALPGLTSVALSQTANSGDTQIVLPLTPGFSTGNRVLIQGGSAGDEIHHVTGVNHDSAAASTTLQFGASDLVMGTLTAGTATASVIVPVIVETPPLQTTAPSPAVVVTHLDIREDLERTAYITQRDSFRPRDSVVVCSVRSAARAYLADYQITILAPVRTQQRFIHTQLLQQLSMDIPLRINGVHSPVCILPPPVFDKERKQGILAPVYVRIGTRMETASRQEQTWVRRAEIDAATRDAPEDQERIVLEL